MPAGRDEGMVGTMDDQRSVVWRDGALWIIDQTVLPGETRWLQMTEVDALIAAIRSLAVRGAPTLGVAGAYGVAVAVLENTGVDGVVDVAAVRRSSEAL